MWARVVSLLLSVLFGLGCVASLHFGLMGILCFVLIAAHFYAAWESHREAEEAEAEKKDCFARLDAVTRAVLTNSAREKQS